MYFWIRRSTIVRSVTSFDAPNFPWTGDIPILVWFIRRQLSGLVVLTIEGCKVYIELRRATNEAVYLGLHTKSEIWTSQLGVRGWGGVGWVGIVSGRVS